MNKSLSFAPLLALFLTFPKLLREILALTTFSVAASGNTLIQNAEELNKKSKGQTARQ